MQLKRAAEENAVLLGGQKLCDRAVSVAQRLGLSSASFLQLLRHYMAQAADQDAAGLNNEMLRTLMARFLLLLRACPKSTPALSASEQCPVRLRPCGLNSHDSLTGERH